MKEKELIDLCYKVGTFYQLESLGFIKKIVTSEDISFENSIIVNEVKVVDEFNIEAFVEEYRNIFPKGVRSGNYLVKGSKSGCISKMKKFIRDNPKITQEQIIEATINYVKRMEENGYKYMQLAHFFIYKNGNSNLEAEIELLNEDTKEREGSSTTL